MCLFKIIRQHQMGIKIMNMFIFVKIQFHVSLERDFLLVGMLLVHNVFLVHKRREKLLHVLQQRIPCVIKVTFLYI